MRVAGALLVVVLVLGASPTPGAATDWGRVIGESVTKGLLEGLDQDVYDRYQEEQFRQELLNIERERLYQEQLYHQQRLYQEQLRSYEQQRRRPVYCQSYVHGQWVQTICR
jgi:Sec-independent protein translocase protein TatA